MTAATPASPLGSDPRASEPSMEEILASIRRIIADDQSLPGLIGLRDPAPAPTDEKVAPAPMASEAVHILRLEPAEAEPAAEIRPESVPEPRVSAPAAHGPIAAPQFAGPGGPAAEPAVFAPEPPMFAPAPQNPIPESARFAPEPVPEARKVPEPEPYAVDAPDIVEFDAPLGKSEPQRPVEPPPADSALFSTATGQSISSAFNMLAATRLADNSDELLSMVREMIRPLLKAWLDDNLPSMVERLVRAEIERVSRGGH